MKLGSSLSFLTLFLFAPKFNALQLLLDNVISNGNDGLIVQNVSKQSLREASDLVSSLVLIEYRYFFIDDDDINDKGLSRGVLSALGRRRRRRRNVPNPQLFRCLGNLITTRFVVTAASCVKYTGDYKPYSIRLADHRNIDIDAIISHENYRANIPENFQAANTNNIALVKLKTAAVLGKQVTVIGLPTSSDAKPLTVNWRLLDDSVLPSNVTSVAGYSDNERYNFEVMPTHVYTKRSDSAAFNLKLIIADGGIGTAIGEYTDWIESNML